MTTTGEVGFVIGIDYEPGGKDGVVQIVISLLSGVHKGRRSVKRYEWYAHSGDPTKVALEVIDVYREFAGKA